jgi:hypothetical protein
MTKRKGEGPYHNNPDKERVREMEVERTRPKTCDDGVSLADILDTVSNNCGLTGKIRKR